jgi:hypothetical protein
MRGKIAAALCLPALLVLPAPSAAADTGQITGIGGKRAPPTAWSTNWDRPCTGGSADSCSGIAQSNWEFTRMLTAYTG